jgi:hypothetical protein
LRHATEDEGEFQSEEQLEEAGDAPAGELAEASCQRRKLRRDLSDKTAEEFCSRVAS